LWLSHDEHGDGDVVVLVDVLGLASGSLSNGIEGIVTNNLSEGLESHGLDVIEWEGWRDNNTDGVIVINWHLHELLLWSKISGVSGSWGFDEVGLSWLILVLAKGQKSLNGVVELLVKLGLLGWDHGNVQVAVINWSSLSLVDALDGSVSLEVLRDLSLDLSEILRDIGVALLESLLGELSDLSSHHALLVLEKAV